MMETERGATTMADLFGGADGLTKVADVFVDTLGRELSPDALQCLMFLAETGCADVAGKILKSKRYMANARDMASFVEKLSPAQHAKDMLEAQAKAMSERFK